MFIKLLSGDLIELDFSSLKEIKSHLSDLTNTPRRFLKLINSETGLEILDHTSDVVYLYSSKYDISEDAADPQCCPQPAQMNSEFTECSLFKPLGFRRVKPSFDLNEFREAICGKNINIQESLEEEVIGDYPLAMFMIDYLHPAFLLDYLPLLDLEHFGQKCQIHYRYTRGDPIFHLLTQKFFDNHREEDEELLLLLFKRIVPKYNFHINKEAYQMAVYHGYESIVRYFLKVNPNCVTFLNTN